MTNTLRPRIVPALVVGFCALCGSAFAADDVKQAAPAGGNQPAVYRLSEPYRHENLTIYLVLGPSTLKGEYLTLEEAMKQRAVRVHETDDVNELTVENRGGVPVFIQSGDIVKGGKQDRTIGTDFILAPKSGKIPVAAFCVESGRWDKRGGESSELFASSSESLAGRQLKLAANSNYSGGQQGRVWHEVAENQGKLRENLKSEVAAEVSPSSLQLTLEDKDVRAAVERYVKALGDAPKSRADVIGYAAVINGKVNCADVYGSGALFAKLWPRLLRSLSAEAAAEMTPGSAFKPVPAAEVEAALRAAGEGGRKEKRVGSAVSVTTVESDHAVQFESRVAGEAGYLRRSILAAEPEAAAPESPERESAAPANPPGPPNAQRQQRR
jgi:hypothetical protein